MSFGVLWKLPHILLLVELEDNDSKFASVAQKAKVWVGVTQPSLKTHCMFELSVSGSRSHKHFSKACMQQ